MNNTQNMKLESHSTATVTTETYQILTESHGLVVYIVYLNDQRKIVDEMLRDDEGNTLDDPALFDDIQDFVDNYDEQQRRDEKNGLYGDKVDDAN